MFNILSKIHGINPDKSKFFPNTWMSPTFETILLSSLKTEKITVVNITNSGSFDDKIFFRFHGNRTLHSIFVNGKDSVYDIKEKINKLK